MEKPNVPEILEYCEESGFTHVKPHECSFFLGRERWREGLVVTVQIWFEILFWLAVALIVYAHVGYALVLRAVTTLLDTEDDGGIIN